MLQKWIQSRRGVKRGLFFIVGGVGVIFFVLSAAGLWVQRELGTRLKIQIQGRFEPVALFPSFYLRDLQFTWKEKVKLTSGDLKVNYRLGRLLERNGLGVELEGKNLEVEFLDKWAKLQGVEKVTLQSFYADLELGPEGLREVYSLDARAPSFQFRIRRTENNSRALSAPGEKL